MRVHNLVKDLVVQKVEEMFTHQEELDKLGLVSTLAAKMDVVCYVLNRTAPQYVVSGRGIAHSESQDYQRKLQQLADITRLVKEGMTSVATHIRDRGDGSFEKNLEGKFFNFPSIIGRMFNGINFEPIHDISVSLVHQGKLVKVIDPNWQNPYKLVVNTAGTFLFWPHPIPAENDITEKVLEFELAVTDEHFEPLHYFFEVHVKAENEFIDFVNTTESLRIKDLYLFPKD